MWHFDAGFLHAEIEAEDLEQAKAVLKAGAAHLEENPVYSYGGGTVRVILPDAQIDDDRNWNHSAGE